MTETLHLIVNKNDIRLDKYVAQECPGISRSYAHRLISQGLLLVNQRFAKPSLNLNIGDKIDLTMPSPFLLVPQYIPLRIVYEDSHLLVVDKPAGLTVHPTPHHPDRTLANAILAHCPHLPDVNGSLRPGIVHRLDKDTSGLIVVAKTRAAHVSLSRQLKSRLVRREYLVLVQGQPALEQNLIEVPIGRHPHHRKRMAVVSGGREAYTSYQVVEQIGKYALLKVAPETGRTHQIRVHLSTIGHPVVGDATYGVKLPYLQRHFVHAHRLGFTLPGSNQYAEFESELPPDLAEALDYLRSNSES